jgi:hypothetical protein
MSINWEAGATLERAEVTQHAPGKYAIESTVAVWSGTLGGAVRQYLEKPDSQKPRYNIVVGNEAGTEKTILDWRDIEKLAQQDDFPTGGSEEKS